jgi:hypothetical protein
MKTIISAAAALALSLSTAQAATVVLTGTICDTTCLGYADGDNKPDYLALFGPAFGDLMGRPFTLDIGAITDTLTIGGHSFSFAVTDPHYSISFTNPLLSSFAPGAFVFTAIGTNPFGIAVAETEFGCPVPEPATWALLLLGFFMIDLWFINKRRATT